MRQIRCPSFFRHLFAEQHVYVRSGAAGRYVVLSWPWQLGVALALAGIVVWAGAASYGWIATHLAALEQGRELVRLAQLNRQLEVIAASYSPQPTPLAPTSARLVIGLEEMKTGTRLALRMAEAAVVENGDRRRDSTPAATALVIDDQRSGALHARLAEQLPPAALPIEASVSGRDWLYDRITWQRRPGPPR